ncbi:MAG: S-layer homology domain-containing protein [Armatimonadetes bacterium]|nr:S-layer homology domain-containing protein [Armatimonadota bacterium]
MNRTVFVLAVIILVAAVPVFSQGPFNDVPTDHWAYDAVNQLQKDGYIIGYPDGTFSGKRAITRYEFAVAIARVITHLPEVQMSDLSEYVKRGEIADFVKRGELAGYVKTSDLPDISKLATKADVDAIKRLTDEFRDELAALGTDMEAMKKDIAALDARVCMLEAEMKRVKLGGDVNVFGIATNYRSGTVPAYNRDERPIPFTSTLGRNISVLKDFDLTVVGRVTSTTTANATINYGNYLNFLAFVDDYAGGRLGPVGGIMPTQRAPIAIAGGTAVRGDSVNTLSDAFFPYYLYIDAGLGKGEMSVGRFPLQFTPYTLKKIDVDSYTSILKTDSGNYPVDGAKLGYNWGGVDLTLFAVKHDTNDYLINGLTGQPAGGIYDKTTALPGRPFNVVNGNSVGGIDGLIAQSAGARAVIGIPWNGNLGLTYYQSWSQDAFNNPLVEYDQARIFGGDLNIPFATNFLFSGSWTESQTLAKSASSVPNVTEDNQAWDAKLGYGLGKLGIGAGYKHIGPNFAAAGAWDKIGRWTNPTNVQGPYAAFVYPISDKVNLVLNGEWLSIINTTANTHLVADDSILHAEGGIRWGISRTNSLAMGYEWNRFSPDIGNSDATETYLNIGWAHQMGGAGLQIGYQFVNYEGGTTPTFAYGPDPYHVGQGVVQFGVSF